MKTLIDPAGLFLQVKKVSIQRFKKSINIAKTLFPVSYLFMPYFSLFLKYAVCSVYVCLKCWEPSACSDPSMFQRSSLPFPFLPRELRTTLLCFPLSPSFQQPEKHHCDSFPASLVVEVLTNTCKTFTQFPSFFDKLEKPIELGENHLEFRSEVRNDFIFLLSTQ